MDGDGVGPAHEHTNVQIRFHCSKEMCQKLQRYTWQTERKNIRLHTARGGVVILEVDTTVDLSKSEVQPPGMWRQLADKLSQVPVPCRLAQERREPDPPVRRLGLEAAGQQLLQATRCLVRGAVPPHERGAAVAGGCVEELGRGGDGRAHGPDVPEPGDGLHGVDVRGQVVGDAVREAAQLDLAVPAGVLCCFSCLAPEPAKISVEYVVGNVDGRPDRDPVGFDRVGDILLPEPPRHARLCILGWSSVGVQLFTAQVHAAVGRPWGGSARLVRLARHAPIRLVRW